MLEYWRLHCAVVCDDWRGIDVRGIDVPLSGSLIPQSKLKLGDEELLYAIHRPGLNVLRIYSTSDQQGDDF